MSHDPELRDPDLPRTAKVRKTALRTGWTTGTCASAAAKAATTALDTGQMQDTVEVGLPDGTRVRFPVDECTLIPGQEAEAVVVKDAGDDPDVTHGARLTATVRWREEPGIELDGGVGVGVVTKPGLGLELGGPAINPVPRAMITQAVGEAVDLGTRGVTVIISVPDGERMARKTTNARLGIIGGISILGTTGVVEPMSLAAYMASIEVYIRVALGGGSESAAYAPGKIGTTFARQSLHLPQKRVVQISNFIGFALDCTNLVLAEEGRQLPVLWMVGHPGKLAKTLDDIWDTHSGKSPMAMTAVARVAADCGFSEEEVQGLRESNTVEAAVDSLRDHPRGRELWNTVEKRISSAVHARLEKVERVETRLFGLHGVALGQAA